MIEIYKKMDLHALLETIQANLAINIDSIYEKANSLIGTGKIHNLGTMKEKLKGKIETYIKTVVHNVIHHLKNEDVNKYNPFIQPVLNEFKNKQVKYLEKAIE